MCCDCDCPKSGARGCAIIEQRTHGCHLRSTSMTTEYTISDIQDHVKKEDLFIVVHGKGSNPESMAEG